MDDKKQLYDGWVYGDKNAALFIVYCLFATSTNVLGVIQIMTGCSPYTLALYFVPPCIISVFLSSIFRLLFGLINYDTTSLRVGSPLLFILKYKIIIFDITV